MKKPFLAAIGLALFPDFTEVNAGRKPAPFVDHDRLDYGQLQKTLESLFPFSPGRIRIANDTIDQITMQIRLGSVPKAHVRPCPAARGPSDCTDFGEAMIKTAQAQPEGLLDVRKAWTHRHYLPDRTVSPPPCILPFIVEAKDFVGAMLWLQDARRSLALKPQKPALVNENDLGQLPPETLAVFESLFGCPYEASATVMCLGLTSAPDYVKQLET